MDIRQTTCPSRHKGVLGGQQLKSLGKLSNGWTDWHQLWFTPTDSSGNGQGHLGGGGLVGHKFKTLGKLSNSWTDWHQIWHACGDSSGNGYTPNKLPLKTQGVGGTWGVLGDQTFKSLGKLSNGCTDWHQIWYTPADSSGNGHRLNGFRPTIPQAAFRGF